MKITYKIENQKHNIYIKKNINSFIISEIKKLHSDKNILFVYDGNISSKIIKNLLDDLKLSGCKIFFTKLESSKKNKNQKLLFNIIDALIENNFSNVFFIY